MKARSFGASAARPVAGFDTWSKTYDQMSDSPRSRPNEATVANSDFTEGNAGGAPTPSLWYA
jgi:hypothetical protein